MELKKKPSETPTIEKLNGLVLDVEFLLISVIQAAALASLAIHSAEVFSGMDFRFLPYIISGFLFILIFWSQAIIHAISFIKWPLDLIHSLFYFLASLFEVMAFEHLTDPLWWFGFIFLFMLVAGMLYLYDLRLIMRDQESYQSKEKKNLYTHMIKGQLFDLKFFVPAALLFNGGVFVLIWQNPVLLLENNYHLLAIILQAIFGFVFLVNSVHNFKKRTHLISECVESLE